MLQEYRQQVAERAQLGIPPLPLDAQQTSALCELLKNPPTGEEGFQRNEHRRLITRNPRYNQTDIPLHALAMLETRQPDKILISPTSLMIL
jgi:aconitase B